MPKDSPKKTYLVPDPKARLRQGTFEKPRFCAASSEEVFNFTVPVSVAATQGELLQVWFFNKRLRLFPGSPTALPLEGWTD